MREKDHQIKIDRTKARFSQELDRLVEQLESGVITVSAELRVNGGGIRSSEISASVRMAV